MSNANLNSVSYREIAALKKSLSDANKKIDELCKKPTLSCSNNTNMEIFTTDANPTFPAYAVTENGIQFDAGTCTAIVPKAGLYRVFGSYTTQRVSTTTSNSVGRFIFNGDNIFTVMANYCAAIPGNETVVTSAGEMFIRLNAGDLIYYSRTE